MKNSETNWMVCMFTTAACGPDLVCDTPSDGGPPTVLSYTHRYTPPMNDAGPFLCEEVPDRGRGRRVTATHRKVVFLKSSVQVVRDLETMLYEGKWVQGRLVATTEVTHEFYGAVTATWQIVPRKGTPRLIISFVRAGKNVCLTYGTEFRALAFIFPQIEERVRECISVNT